EVACALAKLAAGPAVHEISSGNTGTWTILDQISPGTPLAETDPATNSIDRLTAPLAAIADQPAPVPEIPSIVDWLRIRLEADDLAALAPGTMVAPAGARARALDVLDQLAADYTPKLCHGDASPWNILADQHKGWTLIDPRGMSGEVHYDIAV